MQNDCINLKYTGTGCSVGLSAVDPSCNETCKFYKSNKLKLAFTMDNGYSVYYKDNEAGGRTYLSDEIDGGCFLWDTCLANPTTIQKAIDFENELYEKEKQNEPNIR